MTFRTAMTISAGIFVGFTIYLSCYGAYILWNYHIVIIPEAADADSHGMSRLVGYTFGLLLAAVLLGLAALVWFCKDIVDTKAQQAITLGLFFLSALALLSSLLWQLIYWQANWGKFYVATFSVLTLLFGYVRFIRSIH